ncbi:FHA domain-containing protein [Leifsonia shinshuensis]|uniref:FHA domain-containing protein n=1 Tax=Leifsonia shinshuensis TaxID=150026 RepID=A0A7G6Y7R2_9MICO|nr:FHA domain-containing protein [Leifsonia shinshuensis]QNE34527.1 FHA domain-containing protein [Leifsonia shinshuensis]
MGTDDTRAERPGFIVPPPGLIPSRGGPAEPEEAVEPPAHISLPSFRPAAAGAPAPAAVRAPVWRLTAPGGRSIPVTATVLLGRNPSSAAHAGPAELVALEDPTSTVSKTHAAVAPAGDALQVTDLHSTNGVTVVTPDGQALRVVPGTAGTVESGGRLLLGELGLRVERS